MPEDRLRYATLKIERANQYIRDTDAAIKRFRREKPYRLIPQLDASGAKKLLKVFFREIPDHIPRDASSAIHNLRSALDALAWAVASRNGKPPNPKAIDFPILDGPEKFEDAATQGKIEKIGADWVAFLRHTKPYRGGNDLLWALHAADIEDKHRSVIAVIARMHKDSLSLYLDVKTGEVGLEIPVMFGAPLDSGTVIASYSAKSKYDPKVKFAIDVTFRDIDVIEGQPVITALQQLSDHVTGIINAASPLFSGLT